MKRTEGMVLAVGLAVIAGGALLVKVMQERQRLGTPGVRVSAVPIMGEYVNTPGQTNRLFMAGTNSVVLPETVLNYESKQYPVSRVVYDWLPKDTVYGQRIYSAPDGFFMQNFVVLMGADRTSIHQPQYCLYGAGWQIVDQSRRTIRMAKPHPYDLPVMRLTTASQRKLEDGRVQALSGVFVYWFVADGQLSADHKERMWWMARDLIKDGVLQRWAYVTYFAVCYPGQEEETYERMERFIVSSVPEFQLTTGAPTTTLTKQ